MKGEEGRWESCSCGGCQLSLGIRLDFDWFRGDVKLQGLDAGYKLETGYRRVCRRSTGQGNGMGDLVRLTLSVMA